MIEVVVLELLLLLLGFLGGDNWEWRPGPSWRSWTEVNDCIAEAKPLSSGICWRNYKIFYNTNKIITFAAYKLYKYLDNFKEKNINLLLVRSSYVVCFMSNFCVFFALRVSSFRLAYIFVILNTGSCMGLIGRRSHLTGPLMWSSWTQEGWFLSWVHGVASGAGADSWFRQFGLVLEAFQVFNLAIFWQLHLVNNGWSCILCEVNPPRAFIGSFQHFEDTCAPQPLYNTILGVWTVL